MRLSFAFAVAVAVTSCKTANNAGGTAEVKDVESVKKVAVVQGNRPSGEQIAIIRCAPGWVDASGQTEFAVPWNQVKNDSYAELEQKFCTQLLGNGGGTPTPPPPGGGAPVKLGYYALENGTGCSTFHLTPKTQSGVLKGITAKCVDDDVVTNFTCGAAGSCIAQDLELNYFDDGVVELTQRGNATLNYKFLSENDTCIAKAGKRFRGHCWFFASAPNLSCGEVCAASQLGFDETGASKGTNNEFCHVLGQKFGMPAKDINGAGEGKLGCVHCTNQLRGTCSSSYVGVWHTGPSTIGEKRTHLQPFCPCK